MNVLRSIEQKIESVFEGVFGRAFRANVQPVELARKLVKEMDDHRLVSVSRVYVPNEYTIYLSSADREQFTTYEASLRSELQDYLIEHARREGYALTAPTVSFTTDDDLEVGEFGIATRMAQSRRHAEDGEPEPPAVAPGATMVYRPKEPPDDKDDALDELEVEPEVVSLTVDGARHLVEKRRIVIGRSKECDIQLQDTNVSRQHAELRQEGTAYWVVDLDSTNGTEVNGRREKRAKLEDGDKITIGSTELLFERARQ